MPNIAIQRNHRGKVESKRRDRALSIERITDKYNKERQRNPRHSNHDLRGRDNGSL